VRILLISDRRVRPLDAFWPFLPAAAAAGLTDLMIREKDLAGGPLFAMTRGAVTRCRPLGVRVIVNDRVDVALAAGADGVHLGVAGIPVTDARRIAGGRLRVGASTHSLEEIRAAGAAGADEVTFGPVFETPSKAVYGPPVGVGALVRACGESAVPVLALGGISAARIELLRGTRLAGVAAISSILAADDPAQAVRELAAALALLGRAPEPGGAR
jgi:thiamine-phosphate pyrophosphorylase